MGITVSTGGSSIAGKFYVAVAAGSVFKHCCTFWQHQGYKRAPVAFAEALEAAVAPLVTDAGYVPETVPAGIEDALQMLYEYSRGTEMYVRGADTGQFKGQDILYHESRVKHVATAVATRLRALV